MRIWIIEDEPILRDLCFQTLRTLSTRIVLCDAVKLLKPERDDIVVMDLHGTESERLIANGAHVIRMTGDTQARADLYKPFDMSELAGLVERKMREIEARNE